MSAADTARSYYTSARTELIERMRLRDNAFVFYLAAVGTVFGVGLGATNKPELLMLVPFFSLGAATIISQHFAVMGALASYCVFEVGAFLHQVTPSEGAPQWDDSAALGQYRHEAIRLRTWGHSLLIILPAIIALYLNVRHGFTSPTFPLGILWWLCLVSTFATAYIIYRAHACRTKIFDTIYPTPETPPE